jgi:hypothetical protein
MAPQGGQDQGWIGKGSGAVHRWFLNAKDAGKFAGMSPSLTDDLGGLPGSHPSFRL